VTGPEFPKGKLKFADEAMAQVMKAGIEIEPRTSLPLVLLVARRGIPQWKIYFIADH